MFCSRTQRSDAGEEEAVFNISPVGIEDINVHTTHAPKSVPVNRNQECEQLHSISAEKIHTYIKEKLSGISPTDLDAT